MIKLNEFQNEVDEVLVRHRSILDIITKLDEYTSRINRAVIKSATYCGCITIKGEKQEYDIESFEKARDKMKSHVEGDLCPECQEVLIEEIGNEIFYLAALLNIFNINLEEVVEKEFDNLKTLGIFSLK